VFRFDGVKVINKQQFTPMLESTGYLVLLATR
jgi:hypothetical protein